MLTSVTDLHNIAACITYNLREWLEIMSYSRALCVLQYNYIVMLIFHSLKVAEQICLILLDELLFQQLLEVAVMGTARKTSETLAGSILNGKPVRYKAESVLM